MTDIEEDLRKLLAGEVVPIQDVDLRCRQQSKAAENDFKPIVKKTMTYIVMAIVFNEEGRVALIQEAKSSCHGLWYLPAGRVEPGENLVDAAKREVMEEAGINFEPKTLLSFKILRQRCFRPVFVGKSIGGKLKTLDQKDEESLQAKWFTVNDILLGGVPLRHQDFFKSLKLAQAYMAQSEGSRHPAYQIGIQPHHKLIHRPVIVRQVEEGSTEMLVFKKNGSCIPSWCMNPQDAGIVQSLHFVFKEALGLSFPQGSFSSSVRGLLTVEHCGVPAGEHDGICLTSVVMVPSDFQDTDVADTNYEWHAITNQDVLAEFNRRLSKENLLIPILM